MKKSQWLCHPKGDGAGGRALFAAAGGSMMKAAVGSSASLLVAGDTATALAIATAIPVELPKAAQNGRQRYDTRTKHGQDFGAAPLTGITDSSLRARIVTLIRGITRAKSEANSLAEAAMQSLSKEMPLARRGEVLADITKLEQELEMHQAEWNRRHIEKARRRREEQRPAKESNLQQFQGMFTASSLTACASCPDLVGYESQLSSGQWVKSSHASFLGKPGAASLIRKHNYS